ncbi:MAG: sulfatase, partial [Opitutales bacterium]|nr:sulfatase [Opitutales bacterium]
MNTNWFSWKHTVGLILLVGLNLTASADGRPNILLAIGDDISWQGIGAYGAEYVDTPTFDRLAVNGVLFNNAYCSAPGCSPSRAALLTGQYIWQIQEAGTHGSDFPRELKVYPELLETEGYEAAYTGKPWGPGKLTERDRNPAGAEYNNFTLKDLPAKGISNKDYARNFKGFLDERSKDKPFVFWFGAHEAHRSFELGSGAKNGIDMGKVRVPGFLPNTDLTREDVADYGLEIEWFDSHLGQMIETLREAGELENTIIVVTADNGMAFPRAKANNYEYGVHMPLIISWPAGIKATNRRVEDFVSLIDLAPTFLEAAGVDVPGEMSAKSLMPILKSNKSGQVEAERT